MSSASYFDDKEDEVEFNRMIRQKQNLPYHAKLNNPLRTKMTQQPDGSYTAPVAANSDDIYEVYVEDGETYIEKVEGDLDIYGS